MEPHFLQTLRSRFVSMRLMVAQSAQRNSLSLPPYNRNAFLGVHLGSRLNKQQILETFYLVEWVLSVSSPLGERQLPAVTARCRIPSAVTVNAFSSSFSKEVVFCVTMTASAWSYRMTVTIPDPQPAGYPS